MRWDDVRYFLAAARAGSLAAAARSLDIEHSTVGRRIAALEETIGAPLVLRNPDGLALTALGRRLVPLAEDAERAIRAAGALAVGAHTRVRLAVPSGMSQLLVRGLAELRRAQPDLTLEITSGSRAVDLVRGEADLAVRAGAVTEPELVGKKLADVALALYASRSYLARHAPIDPDALAGHDIVAHDPALAATPAARWLDARIAAANVVLRSREMTDMQAAIASGLGVGVLPCYLGDDALVRLTAPIATMKLTLVYRRESRLARPIRAVADMVTRTLRAARLS